MVNSQVTTVTLTADTPQEVKFSAAYPYIWVDNKSASDVYASIGGTPEADKDGTYTIAAGSQLRISGGAYNSGVTLLGEGKVQAIASAIASCPFKCAPASSGGGGSTDTVDAVLSITSKNPVQNKAIKAELDKKANSKHTHTKADITDFSDADYLPITGKAVSAGKADKLTAESYLTLDLAVGDWEENSDGGFKCTKTLDAAMPFENFSFEVVLSSDISAAKLQIQSWNYIMADGMVTQATSGGNTTAFTFYAFTSKPTVTLNISVQGVSGE